MFGGIVGAVWSGQTSDGCGDIVFCSYTTLPGECLTATVDAPEDFFLGVAVHLCTKEVVVILSFSACDLIKV